jgi:sugar lactone lactonase YvrE
MSKVATISVSELRPLGRGLRRPECVLPVGSRDVFVPEWPDDSSRSRGGITAVGEDGRQQTWRAATTIDLRPNGIGLAPDGSFLIANLGADGGVWRLQRDGALQSFVTAVDGIPLPPANFVTVDERGRTWISVSTRQVPRQLAWRTDVADGFIVMVDETGVRLVADGLQYTNEVRPDPTGRWLYVVETFGRRLRRFAIGSDGNLSNSEVILTLGHGCFPDGFAFDEEGGIWVTSLVSNRLMRFHDDHVQIVLDDTNAAFVDDVERAFAARTMNAAHLGPIPGTHLQQLTSVAFGGADRRTIYLGSLHASCIYSFRTAIAGARVPQWVSQFRNSPAGFAAGS